MLFATSQIEGILLLAGAILAFIIILREQTADARKERKAEQSQTVVQANPPEALPKSPPQAPASNPLPETIRGSE